MSISQKFAKISEHRVLERTTKVKTETAKTSTLDESVEYPCLNNLTIVILRNDPSFINAISGVVQINVVIWIYRNIWKWRRTFLDLAKSHFIWKYSTLQFVDGETKIIFISEETLKGWNNLWNLWLKFKLKKTTMCHGSFWNNFKNSK